MFDLQNASLIVWMIVSIVGILLIVKSAFNHKKSTMVFGAVVFVIGVAVSSIVLFWL